MTCSPTRSVNAMSGLQYRAPAICLLPDLPFVLRIWIVFLICIVVGVLASLLTPKPNEDQPVDVGGISFRTHTGFNIASVLIVLILCAIYVAFW
ncbi:MAG: hypothetical protein CBC85_004190 [Hyphomonadaceae bacterium TMED125]|nr:MAG: hypothetical protein CBC85_004190 [Hyphomonadaceae bacterium TMED125]|tara:strand:+ start:8888 stop:9169 length:282 start_codon:yes stop_codon:yes gene_type:complete